MSQIQKGQRLTKKEQRILILLLTGKAFKQIAHAVGRSENTVHSHVYNIRKKLGVKFDGKSGTLEVAGIIYLFGGRNE